MSEDVQQTEKPSTESPDASMGLESGQSRRLEEQIINDVWVDSKYEIWRDGIFRRKVFTVDEGEVVPTPNLYEAAPFDHVLKRLERISGRPAYIQALGHRIDDGRELIGLKYLHSSEPDPEDSEDERALDSLGVQKSVGDRWETLWVTHAQIADARKVLDLALDVFPVRTSNAKAMSDFLTDCYDRNVGLVRKTAIVRRAGHHEINGRHGWLVGRRWIGYGRVQADAYDDTLIQALHVKGSEEEWCKFVRGHWERSNEHAWIIRWMLAAACAAPVLRHVDERTFFLHHYTQTGGGKCVDKDALVLTRQGLRRFEDLATYKTTRGRTVDYGAGFNEIPGNRAITVWNGAEWAKASHFYRGKAETLRACTVKGYEITGTFEHPMWTLFKGTSDENWKELQKLQIGDSLQITPLEFPKEIAQQVLPRSPTTNPHALNEKELTGPVTIDEEMGVFLGILVADGYNAENYFDITSDKEILTRLEKTAVERYGCATRIDEIPSETNGMNYRLVFSHGELRRVLEEGGLARVTSPHKETPRCILHSPKNVVREYLRAYIDCEGCFAKDRARIEVTSASEKLSRETQILLLSFGIVTSRKSHVDPKTDGTYWTVKIDGIDDVVRFAREIGVITSERQRLLGDMLVLRLRNSSYSRPTFDRNLPLFDEVASIEPAGVQEVFDLSIPEGRKFVANGLLSHNTTLSRLGQSVFGHPKEFARSLNRTTQNALTEVFKYVSDLPLLLDEMQGRQVNASDFVMQACTEQHKARVRQEGGMVIESAKPWRLLIRTTGEQTLTGADNEDLGGQGNRALEVRHPGLQEDQATEIYEWLENPQHYGHAGLRFLMYLRDVVNDPTRLKALKDDRAQYRSWLTTKFGKAKPTATERQLSAIMVSEVQMLRWVFGFTSQEAIQLAAQDAVSISGYLRVRDSNRPLWERAKDFLVEHRYANAHLYADATTDSGRAKLCMFGSKTSMPLTAAMNAGSAGTEVWYFPSAVNKLLRDKFNAPPDRIWEELSEQGVLDRSSDRIARHRQIKGVFTGKVYVVRSEALLDVVPEPTEVDASDLMEASETSQTDTSNYDDYIFEPDDDDFVLDPDGDCVPNLT